MKIELKFRKRPSTLRKSIRMISTHLLINEKIGSLFYSKQYY